MWGSVRGRDVTSRFSSCRIVKIDRSGHTDGTYAHVSRVRIFKHIEYKRRRKKRVVIFRGRKKHFISCLNNNDAWQGTFFIKLFIVCKSCKVFRYIDWCALWWLHSDWCARVGYGVNSFAFNIHFLKISTWYLNGKKRNSSSCLLCLCYSSEVSLPFLLGTTSGLCSSSCCWSISVAGSLLPPDCIPADWSLFSWLRLLPCVLTDSLLAEPLGVPSSLSRVRTMKTMTTATTINVATIPIKAPKMGVMWKTTAWVVGPTNPARRSTAWPVLLFMFKPSNCNVGIKSMSTSLWK